MSRRIVDSSRTGAGRRVIAGTITGDAGLLVDAPPQHLTLSRDGKWLLSAQAYELWVIHLAELKFERAIEVPAASPRAVEAEDGDWMIGGHHLYRCNLLAGRPQKVGSRLVGYVDHVAFTSDMKLVGVGAAGEAILSAPFEEPTYHRHETHSSVVGPVSLGDVGVAFASGASNAWIVDPHHPQGYTQLRFRTTSSHPVASETIVAVGKTSDGLAILAAADGGIAWASSRLTIAREIWPRAINVLEKSSKYLPAALAVAGDERWVYALRPNGELQRFLVAQPPRQKDVDSTKSGARVAAADPLPPAQVCKLGKNATTFLLAKTGESGGSQLIFGGSRGDGNLGEIWRVNPDDLSWQSLALGDRKIVPPPEAPAEPVAPSFVTLRSKPKGAALRELAVDDVLAASGPIWVASHQGPVLDRPTRVVDHAQPILPGDTVLLPAMVRFSDASLRPGFVLWPGSPHEDHVPAELSILVWGDDPRGWMLLETPQIREQRWLRGDIFPLDISLRDVPAQAPGYRRPLAATWNDASRFHEWATECKRLLKVLW